MKSNVNWLWNKFKDLPTLLKYALSLPIVAFCFVVSFNIASKNNDAYDFFKKIAHNTADFMFPSKSVPTDTVKTKHEPPKADSTLAQKKPDTTAKLLAKAVVQPVKQTQMGSKPKPIQPVEPTVINYKNDLKEVNILFASSVSKSKVEILKSNLQSLTKNQVKISGPEQTDFVENGANILKLPIENSQKRQSIGRKIKNKLKLPNLQIAKNELDITVLKIGKL